MPTWVSAPAVLIPMGCPLIPPQLPLPTLPITFSPPPSKGKDPEYSVSRGIDFQNVAAVINFDVPPTVESYIHRVGRSGGLGCSGGGRGGGLLGVLGRAPHCCTPPCPQDGPRGQPRHGAHLRAARGAGPAGTDRGQARRRSGGGFVTVGWGAPGAKGHRGGAPEGAGGTGVSPGNVPVCVPRERRVHAAALQVLHGGDRGPAVPLPGEHGRGRGRGRGGGGGAPSPALTPSPPGRHALRHQAGGEGGSAAGDQGGAAQLREAQGTPGTPRGLWGGHEVGAGCQEPPP